MNFGSLKWFKSILEMNKGLKIRNHAVGSIRPNGLAWAVRATCLGLAKQAQQPGLPDPTWPRPPHAGKAMCYRSTRVHAWHNAHV
jgi:hypothetical protein